jgi:hypothetical protein
VILLKQARPSFSSILSILLAPLDNQHPKQVREGGRGKAAQAADYRNLDGISGYPGQTGEGRGKSTKARKEGGKVALREKANPYNP